MIMLCFMSINSNCQIDTCALINEFVNQILISKRMNISKSDSIFIYTDLPNNKCLIKIENVEVDKSENFKTKYSASFALSLSMYITKNEDIVSFYFNGYYAGFIKYDGMLKLKKSDNKWLLENSYVVKGVH